MVRRRARGGCGRLRHGRTQTAGRPSRLTPPGLPRYGPGVDIRGRGSHREFYPRRSHPAEQFHVRATFTTDPNAVTPSRTATPPCATRGRSRTRRVNASWSPAPRGSSVRRDGGPTTQRTYPAGRAAGERQDRVDGDLPRSGASPRRHERPIGPASRERHSSGGMRTFRRLPSRPTVHPGEWSQTISDAVPFPAS